LVREKRTRVVSYSESDTSVTPIKKKEIKKKEILEPVTISSKIASNNNDVWLPNIAAPDRSEPIETVEIKPMSKARRMTNFLKRQGSRAMSTTSK